MEPLTLPGTRLLRLPREQGETYRALTAYLQSECDTFFTNPGMNSLYFWTGKTPPTYLTIFEVILLNENEQNRVIAALRDAKRPLIVLNDQRRPDGAAPGPLQRLIDQEGLEVKRIGSFRILKLRGAQNPVLN